MQRSGADCSGRCPELSAPVCDAGPSTRRTQGMTCTASRCKRIPMPRTGRQPRRRPSQRRAAPSPRASPPVASSSGTTSASARSRRRCGPRLCRALVLRDTAGACRCSLKVSPAGLSSAVLHTEGWAVSADRDSAVAPVMPWMRGVSGGACHADSFEFRGSGA